MHAFAHGVYQIGLVQARSWSFMGASGPAFAPWSHASCAVQRGVGISSTRA